MPDNVINGEFDFSAALLRNIDSFLVVDKVMRDWQASFLPLLHQGACSSAQLKELIAISEVVRAYAKFKKDAQLEGDANAARASALRRLRQKVLP
jgi:hypothetical protein